MELPKEYFESIKDISNLDIEKLKKSYDFQSKTGTRFNTKKLCELFAENQKYAKNADFLVKKMQKTEIFGQFSQIPWCENGFYYDGEEKLGKNIFHELGLYYLQEPSAMAPSNFLDVREDNFVLDLCASPGGKATQITEKLKSGFLVANEIVPSRAKVLEENVWRLGLENVAVTNHSPKELEKIFYQKFDRILVDAPCSGEGMFRKNPEAIFEWTKDSPESCAERQKLIVDSAYKMLKPDGKMVYSTCTFSLEENEMIIKYLLENHDDLEVLPVEHKKYNFESGVTVCGLNALKNCARLYPYLIDGEGHFFAVLHKKPCNFSEKFKTKPQKLQKNMQKIKIFESWAKKYLNKTFENFAVFGDSIFANCKIETDKLKILSIGIYLGEIKKEVFVPSWHLAHCLSKDDCKQVQELTIEQAKAYLQGYEVDTAFSGYILLTYKNLPICFGKGVNGKIKNHYPKNLRKKL